MAVFLQNLINGLFLGFIYALIAVGYTMTYDNLKIINFANSELYVLGSFIFYYIFKYTDFIEKFNGRSFILVILFIIIMTSIIGVLIEKIVYKPLKKEKKIYSLISSFAIALFMQSIYVKMFGLGNKNISIENGYFKIYKIKIGESEIIIKNYHILIIILALVLIIMLYFAIKYTKIGKALKVTADDNDMAKLVGINTDNMTSLVFAISSSLAGLAGVFYIISGGELEPHMGTMFGVKAFTAAILGGLGSIPGALFGGLIIGILETMVIGDLYIYKDIVVFLVLIILFFTKTKHSFEFKKQF